MASVCKNGTKAGSIPASRVAVNANLGGSASGLGVEMRDAERAVWQQARGQQTHERPFGDERSHLQQHAQWIPPTYVWFYPDGVDASGEPMKILTPCAHSQCISKYFDLYCNGYEWKNGVMRNTVCTENPVCINNPNTPEGVWQRYFSNASVTSCALSNAPTKLHNEILRQQVEISTRNSNNEIACLIYDLSQVPVKFRDKIWHQKVKILGLKPDLKEMAELDKLREQFILKCWGATVSIKDDSHPAYSHYPQCEMDKKWPRGHSIPRQSWHLTSLDFFKIKCETDDAFYETLRKLNAVIRTNKKGDKLVDFLYVYPRKGCNTEFKKGFCTDLDCKYEHSTFHGAASIAGVTRPTLTFDHDVYNNIVGGGANINANWWRIAASPPTVVNAPKVVELALTESAKVRLLSEVMTWFLAGMPMLVNPRRIEDLPTNPFYSPGEWGNVAENDALPKGLEYLCIEIINWLKSLEGDEKIVVFNEGVQTPSAIREALSKTLSNRAFAQYK